MRIHALSAAAAVVITLVSGCGAESTGPHAQPGSPRPPVSASSTTAAGLPPATGPTLSFDGDYPHTVQGVLARTDPTAFGTPAPAGKVALTVIIEVKSRLTDRAVQVWHPNLSVTWPQCGKKETYEPECGGVMTRAVKYVPRQQADALSEPEEPSMSEMLQPGTAYLTMVTKQIPQNVDINQVKICAIRMPPDEKCIPLSVLPKPH